MKQNNFNRLLSERGEVANETDWQIYPRPQMVRDSFLSLNGKWDFAFGGKAPERYDYSITVPFPPQSILSGIEQNFKADEFLYYRKRFTLPEGFKKARVLLHIGACDQEADVYLNGRFAGRNSGGYNSFTIDITPLLREDENEHMIRATDDPSSTLLPYGKQREKRGGMWYTPISGIWQSVWLESVGEHYIENMSITTEKNRVCIKLKGASEGKITFENQGKETEIPFKNAEANFSVESPKMWSPESPYLYPIKIEAEGDTVKSYFALRDLTVGQVNGKPRLLLNGKPYFFHGLLDQGYFSDGIYTPASPQSYADDILAAKSMGFNTLRKHIKIEPQIFYYYCDKLGMIVFQDMVNNGNYSFIRDTALPTVGLKRRNDKRLHKNEAARKAFTDGMYATLDQLKNHPSVCYWTIFNEGWGQFCADEMYQKLRTSDPTRFIDSASGWFYPKNSDVESPHVYFKPIKLKPLDKPIVVSEFGGYAHKIKEHSFNPNKEFGYRHYDNADDLYKGLEELYYDQVIPAMEKGLCGCIYTQLSDVEDETNGLLTYDRKIQKISSEKMAKIAEKLYAEYRKFQ